ncbi:asparagine synthase-related protein [Lentibacillus salinarum]|uniref:asparagine synthase (glutamine-hydrolyzing) n=2 Tax=Lentibacillus salinarum TaxID=446820 RepID=A0ABW3ZZ14_9BACI
MSDFIFSRRPVDKGKLAEAIKGIYHQDWPEVHEFHGEWGSLAVSHNLYNGFQPYETNTSICVVIGGPVLYFRDNTFLENGSDVAGTHSIYRRVRDGKMRWDDDVSGPFAVLMIDKQSSKVICVTDLMSFIPVYTYENTEMVMLATHVDMLAEASGQLEQVDAVSIVDFLLHGVVTFPYTVYTTIRQIAPASEHVMRDSTAGWRHEPYWIPDETYHYSSIQEAAQDLQRHVQHDIQKLTHNVTEVAQFISGGEDSRVIASLLTENADQTPNGFIFLDSMNREGRQAKKAASAYGVEFHLTTRDKLHYLTMLPPSSDLAGGGSQYFHAHTYGFHQRCQLNTYTAVFGGLFSDALLKGARIQKLRGSSRLPFLPQVKQPGHSRRTPVRSRLFSTDVLGALTERRQEHWQYVKQFRPGSADEWFQLWPSSMNMNIPNWHVNRRLFRSYEPFMVNDVVKISAAVPQRWKLNRRLFHKAFKWQLKPTKWLLHSEGRLPYFPWYVNAFVEFVMWAVREAGVRTGRIKGHQGPWAAWQTVMKSPEWQQALTKYASGRYPPVPGMNKTNPHSMVQELEEIQQINLMQTLYRQHQRKGRS